jgi:hypothetical protein
MAWHPGPFSGKKARVQAVQEYPSASPHHLKIAEVDAPGARLLLRQRGNLDVLRPPRRTPWSSGKKSPASAARQGCWPHAGKERSTLNRGSPHRSLRRMLSSQASKRANASAVAPTAHTGLLAGAISRQPQYTTGSKEAVAVGKGQEPMEDTCLPPAEREKVVPPVCCLLAIRATPVPWPARRSADTRRQATWFGVGVGVERDLRD